MNDASIANEPGRFDPAAVGPYGRHLTLDQPGDHHGVPAADLLDEATLGGVLARHRRGLGDVADTVAAAHWAKHHVTLLVPGVLAAWTLHGVGLDASPGNVRLHLREGTPRRVEVRDPSRVATGDGSRDRVLRTLFGDHLGGLFEVLHDRTGVDPDRLWATTGNVVAWLYDELAADHPHDRRIQADRADLLDADEAPWAADGNPLQGTVRYEAPEDPTLPDRTPVRSACCLKRAVPGKTPCRSCPAVPADRRNELVRRSQGT